MAVTISTRNLVKKYGSRIVVNHVSFEVNQGEIVGLLGPNGAGKTTSFYQVVGLVKPDEGRVFLNDLDITSLPMYKRAQMGIGYLPQEASVFRKLSVEDNIRAILEMTKIPKQQQKQKLESLLTEFRLQHVRKSNGDVLSGGERRRTEIARALAVDPKFILLDEPFAGIDPIAVEDIQSIVAELKYKNIGILITDHNVTETLSICDRAYLLIEGKIFKHGTAEELADDEQVRKLYLGRNFVLRRKDYLHQEAKSSLEETSTADFETVIHKLLQETEKKISILDKIGVYKLNTTLTADLDVTSYDRYVSETKSAILKKYAANEDIVNTATKIPSIDSKGYQKLFNRYDMLVTPVLVCFLILIGFLALIPMFIIYNPLFKELRTKLADVQAALSEVQLMILAADEK